MQKKIIDKDKNIALWKDTVRLAKKDAFSIIIDKIIIIRRIPCNYEVTYIEDPENPCYYGSLEDAFRKVVDYMVDDIKQPKSKAQEVLECLKKIHSKIDRLVPRVMTKFHDADTESHGKK